MRLTMELPDPSGAVCIRCVGPITQAHFGAGSDPLTDLLGQSGHARTIRLNMDRVDFIDSSGIGWLVSHHRRCAEAGGQLILSAVPPVVSRVLSFCKLDQVLRIEKQ